MFTDSSTMSATGMPATVPASLVMLNDALRASGISAIPRDSPLDEVMASCARAVWELNTRAQEAVSRSFAQPMPRSSRNTEGRQRSISPSSGTGPAPVAEHHTELDRMVEEVKGFRRLAVGQKHKISSLEHQLRCKEADVERMRTLLQRKAEDEDRRAALTMTTLREQRIGSSGFVVMNNYQKQIDQLQRENETLSKRNQAMGVRLRLMQDERQTDPARVATPVVATESDIRQIEALRGSIEQYEREMEEKDNNLVKLQAERDRNEVQIFALKEEIAFMKKTKNKDANISELIKMDKARAASHNQSPDSSPLIVAELCSILHVDDPLLLPSAITKLARVVSEVVPPMEAFVTAVCAEIGITEGPVDIATLKSAQSMISDLHAQQGLLAGLAQIRSRMSVREQEVDVIAELHKILDGVLVSDPLVEQIQGILDIPDRERVIPFLNSLYFKFRELSNFYSSLTAELGLRKTCSYAECWRSVKALIDGADKGVVARQQVTPDDQSDASDTSIGNLALKREIVVVPRRGN